MNVVGVGTDIVEIERIKRELQRADSEFLDAWFSQPEQVIVKDNVHLTAECVAVKEAVAKALGTGFDSNVRWLDISILQTPQNDLCVELLSDANYAAARLSITDWFLAVSHCKAFAMATVIAVTMTPRD